MHSNATLFLSHTVVPTVAEFENNPQDVRRGRLAAIVLYHMADHLALDGCTSRDRKFMDQKVKAVRARIQLQVADFSLIRDVADASKHARLALSKTAPRQLSSNEQVSATPGLFEVPFGIGVFVEASEVTVILDDGKTFALLPAVQAVLAEWKSIVT